ncbi:MAG TPA: DUF192 domain-containing protein [bacterium]|nr:DUF192 domain-containing protein [bacterium]
MNKQWLLIIGIIVSLVGCCFVLFKTKPLYQFDHELLLPDRQRAQISILKTSKQQYQGFSHEEKPCDDCGLLFVWSEPAQRAMVMRNMKFSLDFIWLNNRQIVQLDKMAMPEGEKPVKEYQSEQVSAVLEMPAGFIDRHNLVIGQSLDWR